VCAGKLYKGIFALRELAEEVVLEAIDERDVVGELLKVEGED